VAGQHIDAIVFEGALYITADIVVFPDHQARHQLNLHNL